MAVIIARHEDFEPLADLCRTWGATSHWHAASSPAPSIDPVLVLIAADDLSQQALSDEVRRLRSNWPQARIVGLLNFPRRDEVARLESAGCDVVLGKPVMIDDLATLATSRT
jgi:hypothetical protein